MPDMSVAPRIYTVNGPSSTSSSSLPSWLTTKTRTRGPKRARTKHTLGQLELIQDFTFPQAAIKITSTADGNYVVGTGTYKPMVKVWDLQGLGVKFERVTEAENVDFVMLSTDWTKSLHLQADRSLSLHSQSGLHHTLRLPTYGRSLAYHSPSCDALVGCTGSLVYRMNLEEGRFMTPLKVGGAEEKISSGIEGVNCVDVNAKHGLWSFGLDGATTGHIEFWDPRSRSTLTSLTLPSQSLFPSSSSSSISPLSITALKSHPTDGLSLAVGTSTGHSLLYDLRSPKPFAVKDQGYGEKIRSLEWLQGSGRGDGMDEGRVLSADGKVIKVWDKNSPSSNFFSLHPPAPLLSLHPLPSSGLILVATDSPTLSSYYIPELGPAPRWASFLDGVTEELEDDAEGEGRGTYADYKFVDKKELDALGLSHLIGTSTLKPYMHGYFLSLKLYTTARLISTPQTYTAHREALVSKKVAEQAESRIRAKREQPKVNKALAERVRRQEERDVAKEAKKRERMDMEVDAEEEAEVVGKKGKKSILQDDRFKELWENPEFEVDEESREFGMLNPATVVNNAKRKKTAVEEEAEESDRESSVGLSHSESEEEEEDAESAEEDSDSSNEGDLNQYDPRNWKPSERPSKGASLARVGSKKTERPRMVAGDVDDQDGRPRPNKAGASFGQRLRTSEHSKYTSSSKGKGRAIDEPVVRRMKDGGMEMSFIPKSSGGMKGDDDMLGEDYTPGMLGTKEKPEKKDRKVEKYGAGLEKGGYRGAAGGEREVTEEERKGRTGRRNIGRSASKNVFRGL